MPSLHLVVPGNIETNTGGYIYDRRIAAGLRKLGWTVTVHELNGCFPDTDPQARTDAAAMLGAIPDSSAVVIDGLALGGIPETVANAAPRLRLIALIHHPLAEETGLAPVRRERLRAQETAALAVVGRTIVTSPFTSRIMADYGVEPARIGVVEPGTEPAPLATGSGGGDLNLLCVASLTPRKGHAVLFTALAAIADRPWQLTCAGDTTRDSTTADALQTQLAHHGIADRVALLGELPQETLGGLYHRADLFVLPSFYEGYGMAFAEALARGLPIVATTGGAIPFTVPADAGLLVPPGDAAALTEALARAIDDRELRARLAQGAGRARANLPNWDQAAARFAAEVSRCHDS